MTQYGIRMHKNKTCIIHTNHDADMHKDGLLLRQQHETCKLIFAIDCLGYDQKNLRPTYRISSQAMRHAKNDHTSFNTTQTTYETCSDMSHHCMSVNESPCIHLVFFRTPPCKPEAWTMNVALGPQKTTRTIYCISLELKKTTQSIIVFGCCRGNSPYESSSIVQNLNHQAAVHWESSR